MSAQVAPPAKSEAVGSTARAKEFAEAHLQALASEVLGWRRTGVLRGGKLQELAELCKAFTVGDDEMQTAEYLVVMSSLAHAAGRLA